MIDLRRLYSANSGIMTAVRRSDAFMRGAAAHITRMTIEIRRKGGLESF
jgi:hypothetical protein